MAPAFLDTVLQSIVHVFLCEHLPPHYLTAIVRLRRLSPSPPDDISRKNDDRIACSDNLRCNICDYLSGLTAGVASLWSLGNFNYDSSSVPASRQAELSGNVFAKTFQWPESMNTRTQRPPLSTVGAGIIVPVPGMYPNEAVMHVFERFRDCCVMSMILLVLRGFFTLLTNRKTMYGSISSDQFIRDSICHGT